MLTPETDAGFFGLMALQDRDDQNWLCHSIYFPADKRVAKRAVNFAPRTMEAFEPKVRTY